MVKADTLYFFLVGPLSWPPAVWKYIFLFNHGWENGYKTRRRGEEEKNTQPPSIFMVNGVMQRVYCELFMLLWKVLCTRNPMDVFHIYYVYLSDWVREETGWKENEWCVTLKWETCFPDHLSVWKLPCFPCGFGTLKGINRLNTVQIMFK